MIKLLLHIDGMSCGMCESHINNVIRNNFKVKKVSSCYKKGITEIKCEEMPDLDKLIKTVNETGYTIKSSNIV